MTRLAALRTLVSAPRERDMDRIGRRVLYAKADGREKLTHLRARAAQRAAEGGMTAADVAVVVALFSSVMLGGALGAWLFDRARASYRRGRVRREFRQAEKEWAEMRSNLWP